MKYIITIVITLWVLFFIFNSEMALTALISGFTTGAVIYLYQRWETNNTGSENNSTKTYNSMPR